MAIGDGARGVPEGATLTVRDVRAFRVKVLNTVKLHQRICGLSTQQEEEFDQIGADGPEDTRTLLARAGAMLWQLANDGRVSGSFRYRAAKTLAEMGRDLRRDVQEGKVKASELAQRSREHADRMRMEDRKVTILETRLGGSIDPLADVPLDDLKKLRDAADNASAP